MQLYHYKQVTMPPLNRQEPTKWDPEDTHRDHSLPKIIQDLPFDVSRKTYFTNRYVSERWDEPLRRDSIVDFLEDYHRIVNERIFQDHMEDFIRSHRAGYRRYGIKEFASTSWEVRHSQVDMREDFGEALWDNLLAVRKLREREDNRKKSKKPSASSKSQESVSPPPLNSH